MDNGHALVLDNTLMKKSGSKINGADNVRDAVHSTPARPVLTLGLNVVVLALRVVPPWSGEPLALPVLVRLYRKGVASMIRLAIEMIKQVAQWPPARDFRVVTDDAYAPLIRCSLPRTIVVSRVRWNAAVQEPSPQRTGMCGRPRKKGRRLAPPPELAKSVDGWTRAMFSIRGRAVERDLWAREGLRYLACTDRTVLLPIVGNPRGLEGDDYFVTPDTTAHPVQVAIAYADRWAIEDPFRNTKQLLGTGDPQPWSELVRDESWPGPVGCQSPSGIGSGPLPAGSPSGLGAPCPPPSALRPSKTLWLPVGERSGLGLFLTAPLTVGSAAKVPARCSTF